MTEPIQRQVDRKRPGQFQEAIPGTTDGRAYDAVVGTGPDGMPVTSPAKITAAALADLLGYWSAADGPLYRLLATRLGRLADTAELPSGLRLPPERELASALAVSRNTVAMAYQVLRDDGMADS